MPKKGMSYAIRKKVEKNVADFAAMVDRVKAYQRDPLMWVKDIFGDRLREECRHLTGVHVGTDSGLTQQQEHGFEELGKMVAAKIKAHKGETLDETETMYASKIGQSIQAGQGCHARGTQILMADGTVKAVEDVCVSDVLMGDDGTGRRVTALVRGREAMARIQYDDGTFYDVNASHILSLKDKRGEVVNVTVADYRKWSWWKKRKYQGYKVAVDFPYRGEIKTLPPYLMGLWLGETARHVATLTPTMGLSMQVWRVNKELLHVHYGGRIDNDIVACCAIPKAYLTAQRQDRLSLLAGLLDSDGHVMWTKKAFVFRNKCKALMQQVVFLCQCLGFHAVMEDATVTIRGALSEIPTRLKKNLVVKDTALDLRFPIHVTPLPAAVYYGFSLTGNRLYCLSDCTVTHNTGKDFYGALALLWFMYCFSSPKCMATANTAKQLRNVYWAEVSKLMRLSLPVNAAKPNGPTILESLFEWQSERIFLREKAGREWFCEAVTINAKGAPEEQATALAGRHEKYMMIVVDEATGVPDPVFRPLEGTLTGIVNIVLLIFNPTRTKGFAIESQRPDSRFLQMRWNAEESEIVSRTHIAGMEKKYGRNSNPFRIRVLGLPPLSDADTLIPWDWVESAIDRDLTVTDDDPIILGVDVAAGGDKSVIVVRQGARVERVIRKNTKDTMTLVGWIAMEYDSWGAKVCGVDVIGLGHGVVCRLREQGYKVVAVDVRKPPKRQERFKKLRDEVWWELRTRFEEGTISIPNDQDLIDQLGCIKYSPESDGTIKVEGKKEMRKRGMSSPDEADALCIAYHLNDRIYRRSARPTEMNLKGVWLR